MDYRFRSYVAHVTTANLGTGDERLSVVVEREGQGEVFRLDKERELKELIKRTGFEDGWHKKDGRFSVGFWSLPQEYSEAEDFMVELSDAQGKAQTLTEESCQDLHQLLAVVERSISDSRREVARSLDLEHGPDRTIEQGR
jgi:hypothetical protein